MRSETDILIIACMVSATGLLSGVREIYKTLQLISTSHSNIWPCGVPPTSYADGMWYNVFVYTGVSFMFALGLYVCMCAIIERTGVLKKLDRLLFYDHWVNELQRNTCSTICDNYSLAGSYIDRQDRSYSCKDCCCWHERDDLKPSSYIFKNAGITMDEYIKIRDRGQFKFQAPT